MTRLPEPTVLPPWATRHPVARLATSDGAQPHIMPVVFCEFHGTLYIPIDGKRKSGRPLKRLANIERNPAVSLLIDEYRDDWSRLRWLRIDGSAEIVATTPELAAALTAKYPQYQHVEVGASAIRIVVRKQQTWCA